MADSLEFQDVPYRSSNSPSVAKDLPVYIPTTPYEGTGIDTSKLSFDEMVLGINTSPTGAANVNAEDVYTGSRYKSSYVGIDPEEAYAQQQSKISKWGSGLGKFTGTTVTTFVSGTVGAITGVGAMMATGKLSSFYNNPVNRAMDDINKKMEDYLPNYYTQAERDSEWYSGTNIWSANFWSDKVLKNLGFSIGTLAAGGAWGALLKGIGITNALVRAGKGLEAVEAVETAILNAPKLERFGAVSKALNNLKNQFIKPSAAYILSNADRGLISTMGTLGEGSMEALMNMNGYRDKLIQEYKGKYGVEPTGEMLTEINNYSEKVGNYTLGMNALLLTATNYIQLPKILSSSNSIEKREINNITKETLEGGFVEKSLAKFKVAPTTAEFIAGKTGKLFDKYFIKPVGLFVAPVEGFEEFAQYAVQTGTEGYYKRAYENKQDTDSFWKELTGTFGNVLTEGVHETLTTKEGMEGALIGMISGGIQTSFSPFGQNTIKERGVFGTGGVRAKNTGLALSALNKSNLKQVLQDGIKYINIGINSQKLRQQSIINDDKFSEKNYEKDYTLSYIMPRVKYGKLDSIKEELDLYRQQAMSEDGLLDLQNGGIVLKGETKDQFLGRLNSIQETAEQVNKTYELLDNKYSAILDDKGKRLYTDEVIEKLVYASAKIVDFDNRLVELTGSLASKGINSQEILTAIKNTEAWKTGDLSKVLNDKTVDESITKTLADLSTRNLPDEDDIKQDLLDLAEMVLYRKKFLDEYTEIKSSPEKYQEQKLTPEQVQKLAEAVAKKETIKIKTKAGERELEIGTEYFLGRVVETDKDGNEVYRAPKITIIGVNEDGTIKVKDALGRVSDISPEKLEDYNLAKVSSTLSNVDAAFVMENWNTVFNFNFGKDKGGKKPGRLEYRDGKIYFVYKNANGKTVDKQVYRSFFTAKEGFDEALITRKDILVAESSAQKQARENLIAEKAIKEQKETLARTRDKRLVIINEVVKETRDSLLKKEEELKKTKETLSDIQDDLLSIAKLKDKGKIKGKFSKVLTTSKKLLTTLTNAKKSTEKEILNLLKEKEDLEMNLAYFQDFEQNLDELPENTGEFLQELKDQVDWLDDLAKQTGKSINELRDLSKGITEAIQEVAKLLKASVNAQNPEYIQELKDALDALIAGEDVVENLSMLKDLLLGFTLSEDLQKEITINEEKLADTIERIRLLQQWLDETLGEYNVKKTILDKFQEIYDQFLKKQAEDKALQQNDLLKRQYIGTHDNSVQNVFEGKDYEPESKKDNNEVINSTRPIDDGKPSQARINRFGKRYDKLKNKNKIKGIIVNVNNQTTIIPGLVEHLLSAVKEADRDLYKAEDVLALVLVQDNGNGTFSLIDEKGEVIKEGTPNLDKAIYQVFPTSSLSYEGTSLGMFRSSADKDVKTELQARYIQWRTEQLSKTTVDVPQSINVSFGSPRYVGEETLDSKGYTITNRDYDARTTVQEAGLVSASDLRNSQVVQIATNNESVTNGNVTFTTPLGRVFLKIGGQGLAKLFNRKFTNTEVNTIFDVLLQMTKNTSEDGKLFGGKHNKVNTQFVNWLKSVTYWGIARNTQTKEKKSPGYNNIWFEDVNVDGKKVQKLFISGLTDDKTQGFDFTPTGLERDKEIIILLLKELYNNANATLVNDKSYNKIYYEIVGIDEAGIPITKKWNNYQSYLLSDKSPDTSGNLTIDRNKDDIPFVTQFKPIVNDEDTNRKGIYFTLIDNLDARITQAPSTLSTKAEIKPDEVVPKFVLDGIHENSLPISTFGNAKFTLDINKAKEITKRLALDLNTAEGISTLIQELAKEKAYNPIIPGEVVKAYADATSIDIETAGNNLIVAIVKKFIPEIQQVEVPIESPIEEVVKEVVQNTIVDQADDFDSPSSDIVDKSALRKQLVASAKQFQGENWKQLEAWLTKNFAHVPVYRVKNILQGTNGMQAWGMLQDGAIYIYENAEVGTAYHEVFEAVWKMFAGPKEKQQIIDEFRNRDGSYVDRFTGEKIEYKTATEQQLKEELAEEFRDYVLLNKNVASPTQGKSLISRLFAELVNFIKTFFTGKNARTNTANLFDKIGTGYYQKYNPYVSKLSYAQSGVIDIDNIAIGENAELRATTIPITQLHEIMQQMTYDTLTGITLSGKNLFKKENFKKSELYPRLKDKMLNLIKSTKDQYLIAAEKKELSDDIVTKEVNNLRDLYNKIKNEWDTIVEMHQEKLKTLNIEFDENDELALIDDEKGKDEGFGDARKIDSFRKANGAVKLLLSTLTKTVSVNGKREWKTSSIGGVTLIPADTVFVNLLNRISDAVGIDDMMFKLQMMVQGNPDYAALYERLTKQDVNTKVDWNKMESHDMQLISAFWRSMKKQNADTVSVFIQPSGEVVIGDSNLAGAAKQAKRDMFNRITNKIKSGVSYFNYEPKTGKYYSTKKIQDMKLSGDNLEQYVKFLNEVDIDFDINSLNKILSNAQKSIFRKSVEGIRKSFAIIGTIKSVDEQNRNIDNAVVSLTSASLDIENHLLQLGIIKAILETPDFESTYFNINGERTQTYVGTSLISNFYDVISKLTNFNDVVNTQFKYLATDKFSKGSIVLQRLFDIGFEGEGERKEHTEGIMHPVFVDGMIDEDKGKKKQSSKLSLRQRFIQEINLNLNGIFMNLVPGEATIEHALRLYYKDNAFVSEEDFANEEYLTIFRDYFISEVELSRDNRVVSKGKNNKDLRFFKDILGQELHNTVVSEKNKEYTADELYNGKAEDGFKGYKKEIDSAVKKFIELEANDTRVLLKEFGIASSEISLVEEDEEMTQDVLVNKLRILASNYIIANIEMHKLLYSDPYQYSDELKRIKNFNSPGQPLIYGDSSISTVFNKLYNKGYKRDDVGYIDMSREHFRTITLGDVFSNSDLPGYAAPYEETDGGGVISMKGLKVFKLRTGEWTDDNELQYKYDVVYEKLIKGKDLSPEERAKRGLTISKEEKELWEKGNPNVKDTYTPLKPITRGSKDNGRDFNDIVLHKFALVPMSFRILHQINPSSNALKLYDKMQSEDVDYAVYASGSKVGTEKVYQLYKEGGSFNTDPFETEEERMNSSLLQGISKIPYSIVAIQSEVPSKDKPLVTQGSQVTKLVTMDYMEAGVPIDYKPELKDLNARFKAWTLEKDKSKASPLYKEIKHNQELLVAKIEEGYSSLLSRLGITSIDKGFVISDKDKLTNALKDEILKREVNENIIDAFEGFKQGQVVLEATPAYQQIRNILYSIADKSVVSPKISGGLKVQITSALLESNKIAAEKIVDSKGIERLVYASDTLNFYSKTKDGKKINVCELMMGRWFNSSMSDQELLDYLNNTDEGQKILSGLAYRIPTQKQNSIDVFKIAKFLPKEFGDSVVVPSALVKKVGSDFDIDKLSIYLKNIYKNLNGDIKLIPYFGIGEQAKAKFAEMFDKGEFLNKEQRQALNEAVDLNKSLESKLLEQILGDIGIFTDEEIAEEFTQGIDERQTIINGIYRKSLENEYIQSLENLVSNPLNFDNLIKPNNADQLKDLAKKINKKLGRKEIDYSSTGNMLNRRFMTGLRQAFVSGKYAIGIAAVGQTNHAQNQRSNIFIDLERLKGNIISEIDQRWLGDGKIKFQKYNSLDGKASLSQILNQAGNYISDIIGQFIDGYVDISKGPWIMELGATPNVTSTWLLLTKLGVPIDTVAYFMNQPIIKDYLSSIENKGYSWLFNDKLVKLANDNYKGDPMDIQEIPEEGKLFSTIGKNVDDMSVEEKAQQRFILGEFMKYAKIAEHLFLVTQGSNFDTATINDPYLVFKKQMQLKKAQSTIISSVDDILTESFVGDLKNIVYKIRDAFSTILLSDRNSDDPSKVSIRNIMEAVLTPYISLPDRDFVKLSQKAVNDLFDWAMQTNTKVNGKVAEILLGGDSYKSAAKQIIDFVDVVKKDKDHPLYDNIIINSIKVEPGSKLGKPDNIYIAGKDNKAYDQNLVIYGFEELRKYLSDNDIDLYGKIVRLSILQSGLSNSKISFTNLLPYSDFKKVYNNTLSILESFPNLDEFYKLNVFERNNWNNSDVAPVMRAEYKKYKDFNSPTGESWKDPNTTFLSRKLKNAISEGTLPKLVEIGIHSQEGRSDFMVYSWQAKISKQERIKRRKTGDTSHIHKVLMKKVLNPDGSPATTIAQYKSKVTGEMVTIEKYLYKAINAWGDSFHAQELYATTRPSSLDNGFDKVGEFNEETKMWVSKEVSDDEILRIKGEDKLQSRNAPDGLPEIKRPNEKCGG